LKESKEQSESEIDSLLQIAHTEQQNTET
jgi:hypothetical protein